MSKKQLFNQILIKSSSIFITSGALITSFNISAADLAAGAAGWVKEYPQTDGSPARSCATCHGRDLTKPGRQVNTGKPIEPMAPSVNAQRLTDPAKIEKWLLRNCRWTLGRECSADEKADFLAYIKSQ